LLILLRWHPVWNSIAKACNDVVRDAKISKDDVKGIGFDGKSQVSEYHAVCATLKELIVPCINCSSSLIPTTATCSLAVTNKEGVPMSVTNSAWGTGNEKHDIILWADHRARTEAAEINATGSSVLKYVGETMSLEM
jgi:ribulose kinase